MKSQKILLMFQFKRRRRTEGVDVETMEWKVSQSATEKLVEFGKEVGVSGQSIGDSFLNGVSTMDFVSLLFKKDKNVSIGNIFYFDSLKLFYLKSLLSIYLIFLFYVCMYVITEIIMHIQAFIQMLLFFVLLQKQSFFACHNKFVAK